MSTVRRRVSGYCVVAVLACAALAGILYKTVSTSADAATALRNCQGTRVLTQLSNDKRHFVYTRADENYLKISSSGKYEMHSGPEVTFGRLRIKRSSLHVLSSTSLAVAYAGHDAAKLAADAAIMEIFAADTSSQIKCSRTRFSIRLKKLLLTFAP